MDRATEIYRLATGKGAIVVQETTDRYSNVPAWQPLSGARSNRSRLNKQGRLVLLPVRAAVSGRPHELFGNRQPR